MTNPTSEGRPRTLPGQEGTALSRSAARVAGVVIVVVISVAALLVRPSLMDASTGVGEASEGVASSSVMETGHTTDVTVKVDGMAFVPSSIEVPAGDRLQITFVNTGDQRHDLVFANGAESGAVAPGAQAVVDAGVVSADLEGWCSLPGHRQMGMVLDVVAVGAESDSAAGSDSDADSGTGSMHHSGSPADASAPTMADLTEEAKNAEPYPAELSRLDDSTEHSYTFTVTEGTEEVAAGVTRTMWTYNGTSPGPILHGRVGDTFHITLVNEGTMGHSIDFHAGELAPDEPMRTIEPGQSLEYTFTAGRSGVWMYHCSTMPMSSHIANGMFGAVVIEPDGLEEVDRSYVLVQSEMYLGADGEAASATKVAAGIPDVVAFNGRAFQYDAHPLTAKVGEHVRMWVLDAGPNSPWSFHVVGTQFDTVWSEGAYSVYHGTSADGLTRGTTGAQVLSLQAAEGGFVEFVPIEAGHYAIVNHQMSLAEKGAHGVLEVSE